MDIDLAREPPADFFRPRSRYIRICAVLLALAAGGGLLMAYVIMAAVPHSDTMETVALALFVAPGLVFVYFAEKLKAYKRLGPEEREKLAALGRQHPEIGAYLARVAEKGREPIMAEYEAAQDRAEELKRKTS